MMQQYEIEKTLLKHSLIANEQSKVAEQHTDLLLTLTTSYFELLAKVDQQKQVISAQGSLISQCMERIMYLEKTSSVNIETIAGVFGRVQQLEGRSILGAFNQRLEQLEDNTSKYYSINDKELSKMLENVVRRVDNLELWLSTHDHAYFKQEEEMHNREVAYHDQTIKHDTAAFKEVDNWMNATNGNSSFEEYEMHHTDPSYDEGEDIP